MEIIIIKNAFKNILFYKQQIFLIQKRKYKKEKYLATVIKKNAFKFELLKIWKIIKVKLHADLWPTKWTWGMKLLKFWIKSSCKKFWNITNKNISKSKKNINFELRNHAYNYLKCTILHLKFLMLHNWIQ